MEEAFDPGSPLGSPSRRRSTSTLVPAIGMSRMQPAKPADAGGEGEASTGGTLRREGSSPVAVPPPSQQPFAALAGASPVATSSLSSLAGSIVRRTRGTSGSSFYASSPTAGQGGARPVSEVHDGPAIARRDSSTPPNSSNSNLTLSSTTLAVCPYQHPPSIVGGAYAFGSVVALHPSDVIQPTSQDSSGGDEVTALGSNVLTSGNKPLAMIMPRGSLDQGGGDRECHGRMWSRVTCPKR